MIIINLLQQQSLNPQLVGIGYMIICTIQLNRKPNLPQY